MNVLQRFEKRLGGLVEGAFAKVFKGGVEPVEIAGALARECDDKRAISATRVLVPNDFVVELGPDDHTHLSPYDEALGEELTAMVREHAEAQGYSFVGPVAVRFALADDLSVGTFRVRSGVSPAPLRPDDPVPTPAASLAGPRLVLGPGVQAQHGVTLGPREEREFRPTGDRALIGRAPEADLQLLDSGVSRRHAQLVFADGAWWLEDLGSTNGTLVNGRQVSRAELADGDRVELGGCVLLYREAPAAWSG